MRLACTQLPSSLARYLTKTLLLEERHRDHRGVGDQVLVSTFFVDVFQMTQRVVEEVEPEPDEMKARVTKRRIRARK